MSQRQLIQDKLIVDFIALTFEGGNTIFNNVRKFFATDSMESLDCLIIPDSNQEQTSGLSAGNTQTTREYAFRAIVVEHIEAAATEEEGTLKYSRIGNIEDAILDYLQKEPSNLNSWGNTNNLAIFKIRVTNVRYETVQSEAGYVVLLDILFSVFLNVIPQNL